MLRFVFVDVSDFKIEQCEMIIDGKLMHHDIEYDYYSFNSKNKLIKFLNIRNRFNIYIVDGSNSDETIRLIRDDYNDKLSFIILLNNTSFKDYYFNIQSIIDLSNGNKFSKIINEILLAFLSDERKFSFVFNKVFYKLNYNDILYFEKLPNDKTSAIVCKDNVYRFKKCINDLKSMLDDNFIQTHRSVIVNKSNVKSVDFKNKMIVFCNNKSCCLISRKYVKSLKTIFTEYV